MISFLYSTVAIIVAIGYLPQAWKLLRAQGRCEDISIIAWSIWEYTAVISLLYSVFVLEDLKLSIVNGINVFFITVIILVTLYKRWKYAGQIDVLIPEEEVPDLEDVPEVKELDS
tara:strand:+ start:2196 stop:2540 length:345 start_codon:yes stop_codon:yes gene_type:complete